MLSTPPLIGHVVARLQLALQSSNSFREVSGAGRTHGGEHDGDAGGRAFHHSRVTWAETQTQVPFRFCQSSV